MLFLHYLNQLLSRNFNFRNFTIKCSSITSEQKIRNSFKKPNLDLYNALNELANQEQGKNVFKYKAYQRAAKILKSLPERIKSGSEAKKFPGIGEKISNIIDKLLEGGNVRKLDNINKNSISKLKKIIPSADKYVIKKK